MKHRYVPAVVILGILSMLAVCPAQQGGPSMLGGPVAGFGLVLDDSYVPVFTGSTDCGVFKHGIAFSPSLGGTLVLPSLFGESLGAELSVAGMITSGRLNATPVDPTRVNDNGTLVDIEREFRLTSSRWSAVVDAMLRYRLSDRFALSGGPWFGLAFASTFSTVDHLIGPSGYSYAGGVPDRPVPNAQAVVAAPMSFGAALRASYEIPLHTLVLMPQLGLRVDMLSAVKEFTWRRYSAEARVALLFDITPKPKAPEPPVVVETRPDTPVAPVVVVAREKPRLSATVAINGVDEHGSISPIASVRVNDVINRTHAPVIPAVFFDKDSALLPSRYPLLDHDAAGRFTLDDLVGSDLLGVQHRVLDVIGLRMQSDASAKLSLYGSISRDEQPGLGRNRAAAVQRYLEQTWGIAPSRVSIAEGNGAMERSNEGTDDGRADNRRVEFASNHEGILAPMFTEHTTRSFNPPAIKVTPTFEAEAGVKRWELNATQGSNTVAHETGSDAQGLASSDRTWHLDVQKIDSTLSPVDVKLTVEDSTGAVVNAENRMPLALDRRVSIVDGRVVQAGEREQISYTLVGFDYNSAELNRTHQAAVREIAESVHAGAKVTIVGYTDRIGEQKRNVELSGQRADRVAAALRSTLDGLGVRNVPMSVSGGGIETERFPNDLPEGRILSRGVGVVVEQGIGEKNGDEGKEK